MEYKEVKEIMDRIVLSLKKGRYTLSYQEPNFIRRCTAPDGRTFLLFVDKSLTDEGNCFGSSSVDVEGYTFTCDYDTGECTSSFFDQIERGYYVNGNQIAKSVLVDELMNAFKERDDIFFGECYSDVGWAMEIYAKYNHIEKYEFFWGEDCDAPLNIDDPDLEYHDPRCENCGTAFFNNTRYYLLGVPDEYGSHKEENLLAVSEKALPSDHGVFPVRLLHVCYTSQGVMLVTSSDDTFYIFDARKNSIDIDSSKQHNMELDEKIYHMHRKMRKPPLSIDEAMRQHIGYIESHAIPTHLSDVAREYGVRILLAVESGSRAWGFESVNSDWDVRFVYVHQPEWYLRVEDQRDVIERMYDDNVDLAGWELRKALRLFRSSNPSLYEWFNSPKVYLADEQFVRRIREVEHSYFNPVSTMYHYNHIYNKHNDRYLVKDENSLKVFLYYLRGIMACQWIEVHRSLPPVAFSELVDATMSDPQLREKIDELIRLKKSGKEHEPQVIDKQLKDYARYWADYYNERVDTFRPEHHKPSAEALDAILYDMVCASRYAKVES